VSIRAPVPSGAHPAGPPCAVWQLVVEVEFDPRLTPEEMDRTRRALGEAIVFTVEGLAAPFRAGVDLLEVDGRGRDTPLFPLVVGGTRFTTDAEVRELAERSCARGTDLGEVAYDAAGRAYELDVAVVYRQQPALDGRRRAALPSPPEPPIRTPPPPPRSAAPGTC
jgi:hypothetical protein